MKYRPTNRGRQLDFVKVLRRVQVILTRFIDDSEQSPLFGIGIREQRIQLATLQGRLVARVIDANDEIAGFFNVAQPALPHLRRSKGSIVAITTAATRRFPVRDGLSAAGKGAVEQLCWGLAAEEGRFGIRVNCVGPGMTTAGMAQDLTASGDLAEVDFAAATANIPLKRFGDAADIAEAVCFLASTRAGYISGQHLAVDGGYGV